MTIDIAPHVSPQEVARILGKSYRWVLQGIHSGAIRHFRLGREFRVYESEIQRLVQELEAKPEGR